MAREAPKTYEEYFQRRRLLNRLLIGYYIIFIAILVGIVVFLYMWHSSLLRNFNIAFYGTIVVIFTFLYRTFSVPHDFFLVGRYPEFYAVWLASFYEECPTWVKNIAKRSCAKRFGERPEYELPYLTKKMKKFSFLFLIGGWFFMCIQGLVIWKHADFIKILYNLLQPR